MSNRKRLFSQCLGRVLRAWRLNSGESLLSVANRAGCSLGYMSEVERGRKNVSTEKLSAICRAHHRRLSTLIRQTAFELEQEGA